MCTTCKHHILVSGTWICFVKSDSKNSDTDSYRHLQVSDHSLPCVQIMVNDVMINIPKQWESQTCNDCSNAELSYIVAVVFHYL